MEHVGSISEGEWNALNGMSSEEADFMAQWLGNCSLPNEVQSCSNFVVSSTYWPSHENMAVDETAMYSSDETNNTSMYSFSQGSSSYSGGSSIFLPSSSHEGYYPNVSHQIFMSNDNYYMMESKNNNSSRIHILTTNAMEGEGDEFLNQDVSNDSIESNENLLEDVCLCENFQKDDKVINSLQSPRKDLGQRNKRSTKLKKCTKLEDNDEDNNITTM
ncbi:hypothetical protein BUALT_Bualt15G0050000 [Buddleja alternifolia]|uniref:Uncharacterized protein n=1 Tax=Buddleja alternifolia TaxID=168488 RepID=A0AAV6WJA5_9LAMI|nr:hypothetical protein BUALT_Bualt15G0050000 [Buddleja alternifolia]